MFNSEEVIGTTEYLTL